MQTEFNDIPNDVLKLIFAILAKMNEFELRRIATTSKRWSEVIMDKTHGIKPILHITDLSSLQEIFNSQVDYAIQLDLRNKNLKQSSKEFKKELTSFMSDNINNPALKRLSILSLNLSGRVIDNFIIHFFAHCFNLENLKYLRLNNAILNETKDEESFKEFYKDSTSFNSVAVQTYINMITKKPSFISLELANLSNLNTTRVPLKKGCLTRILSNSNIKKINLCGIHDLDVIFGSDVASRLGVYSTPFFNIEELVISDTIKPETLESLIRNQFQCLSKITFVRDKSHNSSIIDLITSIPQDNKIKSIEFIGFGKLSKLIKEALKENNEDKFIDFKDQGSNLVKDKFSHVKALANKIKNNSPCIVM